MQFSESFYRCAAICSVLSVVTTLLLIFLPNFFVPVETFDQRMARVHDPAYVLRSWVDLLHPFLVLTAAFGIAMRIRRVGVCCAAFTDARMGSPLTEFPRFWA